MLLRFSLLIWLLRPFFQPITVSAFASLHPSIRTFALANSAALNVEVIGRCLDGFPDKQFIVHIARHGIIIADPLYPCAPFDERNSRSCIRHQVPLFDITHKSMATGRYFVPPRDLRSQHVHQLACIFNPATNKYREVHNLSKPLNGNVNDCTRYISYRWCRMDNIAKRIRHNMWGCRFDVTDYYRHFCVSHADWHLLAFRAPLESPTGAMCEIWDTRMPFGYRPAVEIAHRMTTAIVYAINALGIFDVFAILDDFFKLSAPQDVAPSPDTYASICAVFENDFRFPLNYSPHKTHPSQRSVEWSGWM